MALRLFYSSQLLHTMKLLHTLRRRLSVIILCGYVGLLCGCQPTPKEQTFAVGVCIDFQDVWHDKMCDEIVQEAVLHPELHLILKNARGDRRLQGMQIDSLLQSGVDLLIIGVEDPLYIHVALEHAAQKGVPVVINSRNPKTDNYTAFVGTDNLQVGNLMAEYLKELAHKGGYTTQRPLQVIEILGVPGTPAVSERYIGLRRGLKDFQAVHLCGTGVGNWSYALAFRQTDSLLLQHKDIDVVVAQNDIMALGAYEACLHRYPDKDFRILGVDALNGPDSGVEAILEGKIAASITNVTRGDLIIQTAYAILHGQPYVRDSLLHPMLVDRSSTRLMMRMSQEMDNETKVIKALQTRMDSLGGKTDGLRTANMALSLCLVLSVLLGVVMILLYHYRLRVHQERAQSALTISRQQQQLEQISAELTQVKITQSQDEKFTENLQRIIEKRLDDPTLSVNSLSEELGVSRAQLFRKVKAQMGITPFDLLHQIRLQKAQQLLRNTDLSVSEVAYSVGFTSSSYFAKCYKSVFGVAPAEDRKQNSLK